MGLGWTLLVAVGGLLVIVIASSWYFSWVMQKLLYDRIEDLEYIRACSLPPDRWQRRFLTRSRKAGRIDPEDQRRQTRKNLKKLDKIIRFAQTTRFMESDEVREEVLLTLGTVKREWEETLED